MSVEKIIFGYCKKCNKRVPRSVRTCPFCGEENATPEQSPEEQFEFYTKSFGLFFGSIIAFLVGLVLLIVIVIIMYRLIEG